MEIRRGRIGGAIKAVLYGPEGIGKSTFASCFPEPVFIDTEGSTNHMDVARVPTVQSWKELLEDVTYFAEHPTELGTLVIDTGDWAEKMAAAQLCEKNKWDSIESPGYGKGYVYLKEEIQKLLNGCDKVIAAGVNVVIVCHAQLRKFEQPDEMGSYDRWALKLNEKNVSPLIKEWADMVLFANYKTNVVKEDKTKTNKATGGKRVMYTTHHPCWDAKNRFGLDEMLPFEFGSIAHLFGKHEKTAQMHDDSNDELDFTAPVTKAKEGTPMVTVGAKVFPAGSPMIEQEEKRLAKRNAAVQVPIPTAIPDCMVSDDTEKAKLLEKLWLKLVEAEMTDITILQTVVAQKGYYDADVQPKDYDADFIAGCLIGAWDKVHKMMITERDNLPF